MNIILPLGTRIDYVMPRCPCNGGGWDSFTGEVIEYHQGNVKYYRTNIGHTVRTEWIKGYDH